MHWLLQRLESFTDTAAVVWRDQSYSYSWLIDGVRNWQRELDRHCVAPGQIAVVDAEPSPESLALFLALAINSNIIMPLEGNVPAQRQEFIRLASPDVECVAQSEHQWRIITHDNQSAHPLIAQLRRDRRAGLILFSSGSTGKSKGIVHNLNKLMEKFVSPGKPMRTVLFLRFDHIGGINTLLHTLTSGGAAILSRNRNPDAICRLIQDHKAQVLPTSPTFLNLLLISEAYKRYDLSSLTLITYGTEPMPQVTLQRIRAALPWVRCKQTYGLTELGILRSQSMDSDSLWIKVGGEGYETKVVNGTLWIRAESAMLGYLNAPSPFDTDGWFNTEDRVEVSGEYIRFLGRESNMINVGGEKVSPEEVENVLLAMDNVADVTVRGEKNLLTGQVVTAVVVLTRPEDAASFKHRMREFCKGRLDPHKIPVRVEIAPAGQVTDRFKKMRMQLAH